MRLTVINVYTRQPLTGDDFVLAAFHCALGQVRLLVSFSALQQVLRIAYRRLLHSARTTIIRCRRADIPAEQFALRNPWEAFDIPELGRLNGREIAG